jgi:hypothetical protein
MPLLKPRITGETGTFEISVPDDFEAGRLPQTVTNIRQGYTLCVYGPRKSVEKFVKGYNLILGKKPKCFKGNMFNPSMAGIVEGVVSPRSILIRAIRAWQPLS